MPISTTGSRRVSPWVVLAIVAVALNLRPALAAVGPLLDSIEHASGMTHAQAGLLTTLPVLVMGVCALAGGRIRRWLGDRNGIACGIVLIAIACALRCVATGRTGLLATAVGAGVGIALVQALLPGIIKRCFVTDAGRIMGLYTTGIMGGAAIAAASAAGFAQWWGWPMALAVWGAPATLCLPIWYAATRKSLGSAAKTSDPVQRPAFPFWRMLRAWELLIFFGIGTGAYTLVLAWLPPFYTGLGWPPSAAGFLLGGVTLAEVVAGLAVSVFVGRFPDRRRLLLLSLLSLLTGLCCLVLAPLPLAWLACALVGIGIGSLFPLSLIVTLDHADDPTQAGELAAFVQGGGYIIASGMPLLAGVLRDHFSDLSQAWIVMMVGTCLLILQNQRFSPKSCMRAGWR